MPILSSSWSQQPNSQRKWRKELNQFSSAPLNNNSLSPVHLLRVLPLILWRSSSFYLFSWRICLPRVWSLSGIHICSFQRCSYTFRFPWCKAFLPPHTRLHLKTAEIKISEHPVKVKSKMAPLSENSFRFEIEGLSRSRERTCLPSHPLLPMTYPALHLVQPWRPSPIHVTHAISQAADKDEETS